MQFYHDIPDEFGGKCMAPLVFDKDGTITPPNLPMTEKMAELFSRLTQNRTLTILTARDIHTCSDHILSVLDAYTYNMKNLIFGCSNGSEIYTYNSQMNGYDCASRLEGMIDTSYFLNAVEYLRNMKNEHHVYFEKRSDTMGTLVFLPRNASLHERGVFDPDGKKRRSYIEVIRSFFPSGKYEFHVGGATSIDISLYTKEAGMRHMQDFFSDRGMLCDTILFFGDNFGEYGNDTPVLGVEGVVSIWVQDENDTYNKIHSLIS